MPTPSDRAVGTTVGVEEEFHLLDAGTGRLAAEGVEMAAESEAVEPEFSLSVVETATAVCRTLEEVRAELVVRRRALAAEAADKDVVVASAGTVPAAGSRPIGIYPQGRFERMAERFRRVADEQQVCACQVQVAVPDPELAIRTMHRLRRWLPVLLALSASSPYFADGDTGYASYRTVVLSRWPTGGPPPAFVSAADYASRMRGLIAAGVMLDMGMVYYDVRPSARYPTLEIRIADACPRVDDVVLLAALGRALVVTTAAEETAGAEPVTLHPELLRAASWRAARSGLGGTLVDPATGTPAPAGEVVDRLVASLRPVLEERAEWDTVAELLAKLRADGTSAQRQRATYERTGDLRAVLDTVVAETTT